MASLGGVFGEGTTANQLLVWGVLNQVLSAALTPATAEIQKLLYEAFPVLPNSPEDAAAGVARGVIPNGEGEARAIKSGIGNEAFGLMVELSRHAPDLSAVMELLRRGKIGQGSDDPASVSVNGALTDAGIRPEWHDLVTELATSIPTGAEVMNAWLEGQISEGEAARRWKEAGGDPTWFHTAYNANGQAPTPVQALELLNRGIIPEGGTGPGAVSYEQAFLEGPWRNKWLPAFRALADYLPPPRTVTAMFHEGTFTHAEAATYLTKQGLSPGLVAKYLTAGHSATTAADKHLAKSDLTTLYMDRLITRADLIKGLEALRYTAADAGHLADLADLRRTTTQVNAAVTRVRTLYVAGKLSRAEASTTLAKLKVPADQVGQILDVWTLEHHKVPKVLTASQLTHAWQLELITAEECDAELMAMGHSRFDAWVLRSLQAKAAQPHKPPMGA